ncbi:hypothetical protein EXD81_10810 [Bacillus amyloliquefaciens]|nr:hypothetical protein A6R78_04695 [Bacillus velezensis]ATV00908.1 hypothetical protein CS301_05890 [Bacillus velezensis]QEK97711.1 hypothetical protein EXD81_10810 [Bacillus amyloliquefaciens]THC36524.1 hypothetical protein D0872_10990 [Bacillus velezensis]
MKKLIDGSTILFFILFVILFTNFNYGDLSTLDIITMILAMIWLVLTIINITLKWRNLRNG